MYHRPFFASAIQPKHIAGETNLKQQTDAKGDTAAGKSSPLVSLPDHRNCGSGGIQRKQNVESLNFRTFTCADYAGDAKLEACLNDKDRLRNGDTGGSVAKVQRGLTANLQENGIMLADDGVFGQKTGQAVMFFKKKHALGFENYPDVGPGTMSKLNDLCPATGPEIPPKDWGTPPIIDEQPPDELPPCPVYYNPQTDDYVFAAGTQDTFFNAKHACQIKPPFKKNPPVIKTPAGKTTKCIDGVCHSQVTDKKGQVIDPEKVLNPHGKQAYDLFGKLFSPAGGKKWVTQVDLIRELVRPASQEEVIKSVMAENTLDNTSRFFIRCGDLNSIISGLETLKDAVNDPLQDKVFLKEDVKNNIPSEKHLILERINGLETLCKTQLENPQALNDPKASDRQRVIAIALSQVGTVFGDAPEAVDPENPKEGHVRIGYKRMAEYFATAYGDPDFLREGNYKNNFQKHKLKGMVNGELKDDAQAEWCGIFILWAFKTAGFSVGNWTNGTAIPHISGFIQVQPNDIKPGDVGMINHKSHQFIIIKVQPDQILITVDGNTDSKNNVTGGQVTMHTKRKVKDVDVGFFRAVDLL